MKVTVFNILLVCLEKEKENDDQLFHLHQQNIQLPFGPCLLPFVGGSCLILYIYERMIRMLYHIMFVLCNTTDATIAVGSANTLRST
jgi:hypothetical protein